MFVNITISRFLILFCVAWQWTHSIGEMPFSGATSRLFVHLEKLSHNFLSSSFIIRVNLLHPRPSLFLYGLLLSLWCFSILVDLYFQVLLNFCSWPKQLEISWLCSLRTWRITIQNIFSLAYSPYILKYRFPMMQNNGIVMSFIVEFLSASLQSRGGWWSWRVTVVRSHAHQTVSEVWWIPQGWSRIIPSGR